MKLAYHALTGDKVAIKIMDKKTLGVCNIFNTFTFMCRNITDTSAFTSQVMCVRLYLQDIDLIHGVFASFYCRMICLVLEPK